MGLKIDNFKKSKLTNLVNITDKTYNNVYVYLREVNKYIKSTREKIFNKNEDTNEDIDEYISGSFYFSTENSAKFFAITVQIPIVNADVKTHLYEEFKRKLDNKGIVYENVFENVVPTEETTINNQQSIILKLEQRIVKLESQETNLKLMKFTQPSTYL